MNHLGMTSKEPQKGFTIVELLIVVVVIAILAAITIVAYNGISDRAKESALASKTSTTAKLLATNAIQNGETYPTYTGLASLGIKDDSDVSYRYTQTGGGSGYCLTVSSKGKHYNVSNANVTPLSGRCAAHAPATITNLSANPSMETALAGHGSTGATSTIGRATTGGLFGTGYVYASYTGSGSGGMYFGTTHAARADVTAGQTYTASIYTKTSVGATITPRLTWFNSGGVQLTSADGESVVTNNTEWKRVVVTGVAPATAVKVGVYYQSAASVWVNGSQQQVDGLMITQGTEIYPYADGTSPGWSWTGAAHATTSSGPSL